MTRTSRYDVANRVILLFPSVRTEADLIGSSSPTNLHKGGFLLVEASSWRCGAWLLVKLTSAK